MNPWTLSQWLPRWMTHCALNARSHNTFLFSSECAIPPPPYWILNALVTLRNGEIGLNTTIGFSVGKEEAPHYEIFFELSDAVDPKVTVTRLTTAVSIYFTTLFVLPGFDLNKIDETVGSKVSLSLRAQLDSWFGRLPTPSVGSSS